MNIFTVFCLSRRHKHKQALTSEGTYFVLHNESWVTSGSCKTHLIFTSPNVYPNITTGILVTNTSNLWVIYIIYSARWNCNRVFVCPSRSSSPTLSSTWGTSRSSSSPRIRSVRSKSEHSMASPTSTHWSSSTTASHWCHHMPLSTSASCESCGCATTPLRLCQAMPSTVCPRCDAWTWVSSRSWISSPTRPSSASSIYGTWTSACVGWRTFPNWQPLCVWRSWSCQETGWRSSDPVPSRAWCLSASCGLCTRRCLSLSATLLMTWKTWKSSTCPITPCTLCPMTSSRPFTSWREYTLTTTPGSATVMSFGLVGGWKRQCPATPPAAPAAMPLHS